MPEDVGFATTPEQAKAMIERAVAAGVPFAWFTVDEVFGQNPGLRDWLQEQDIAYVMATRNDDEVPAGLHTLSPVKDMIAAIRPGAWQRLSCGDGAHGPRVYDWAWTPIRTTFAHDRRGWVWPADRSAPARSPTTGASALAGPGCGTWSGRRYPVGDRGVVPDGEERGRPGPVPGPSLRRLVRAHHRHGRRRVPAGQPAR